MNRKNIVPVKRNTWNPVSRPARSVIVAQPLITPGNQFPGKIETEGINIPTGKSVPLCIISYTAKFISGNPLPANSYKEIFFFIKSKVIYRTDRNIISVPHRFPFKTVGVTNTACRTEPYPGGCFLNDFQHPVIHKGILFGKNCQGIT